MPIYEYEGVKPVVDPTAYIHPTAVLIGDVIIGPKCFVGPCAVLRGDIGRLIMKEGSNMQDTCVVHSFPGDDTIVEENGHIGHGAILHGCIIKRNAMVGMNAVVMDNAVIGENSFVAAMAFVKAGTIVPPNVPAARRASDPAQNYGSIQRQTACSVRHRRQRPRCCRMSGKQRALRDPDQPVGSKSRPSR